MMDCINCGNLDKSRKEICDAGAFRYGCNLPNSEYICGWIKRDNELRWLGCSKWVEKVKDEQIAFVGLLK